MEDLFIKPLEATAFEKVAYMRVSEDPTNWTRDIMEQFYGQFPFFANVPVRVEFRQKDEQRGYAVASIHVEQGEGMVVPVIIKDRELFPFDVCIVKGQVMPLNHSTITMYIQSKGAFLRTVARESGDPTVNIFNATGLDLLTPNYANGVINTTGTGGGYFKGASLLDQVLDKVSDAEKKAFFDTFISDERIAEGFKVNGTAAAVIKVATASPKVTTDTKQMIHDKLDRDIHYIYKEGEFEYKGIFGNSLVDDPVELELDVETATKLPAIKVADAKQLADATPTNLDMKTTGVQSVSLNQPHVKPIVPGKGKVQTPVNLMQLKGSDRKVLLMSSGQYMDIPASIQINAPESIEYPVIQEVHPNIKQASIELGDGTWSIPFSVDRVWSQGAKTFIEGFDGLRKVAYCRMTGIKEAYDDKGVTYVPGNAKMVELGEKLAYTMGDYEAHEHAKITRIGIDTYETSGEGFKEAFEAPRQKTAWALIQHGGNLSDLTKLSELAVGKSFSITHELYEPVTIDKVAEEIDTKNKKYADMVHEIAKSFVKEASTLPSLPTVDTVLALNFVNKDTIATFVQSLPALEQTMFDLADMLLKARIGVQVLNEAAIRKVMFGLVEIIEVLKGIQNLKAQVKHE